MKREKISITILLVDIAHIYVYWNLERDGFYQREMDFLSKRNGFSFKTKWFNKETWNERTKREKNIYIKSIS
jgi:hypothetical protein